MKTGKKNQASKQSAVWVLGILCQSSIDELHAYLRTTLTAALNRKSSKENSTSFYRACGCMKHAREREREFPSHPPILEEQ